MLTLCPNRSSAIDLVDTVTDSRICDVKIQIYIICFHCTVVTNWCCHVLKVLNYILVAHCYNIVIDPAFADTVTV